MWLYHLYKLNIVIMKRVIIFIAFMLIGFTSCDKLRDDSHFIHDGFDIQEGDMSYHYGIRYGLIYCE